MAPTTGKVALKRFVWLSRLVVETCLTTLLVALAIANLSGVSILYQFMELYGWQKEAGPAQAERGEKKAVPVAAPAGPRPPRLSTLREEMRKAGVGTSCCVDERKSDSPEYYVCLGRVPCHEVPHTSAYLKPAPHLLKTPEGQLKEAHIIQNAVMHLRKQLGTSSLRAIFEHIKHIGLACDKFTAS